MSFGKKRGLNQAPKIASLNLNYEFAFRQTSRIICSFSASLTKEWEFINPRKLIFSAVDKLKRGLNKAPKIKRGLKQQLF